MLIFCLLSSNQVSTTCTSSVCLLQQQETLLTHYNYHLQPELCFSLSCITCWEKFKLSKEKHSTTQSQFKLTSSALHKISPKNNNFNVMKYRQPNVKDKFAVQCTLQAYWNFRHQQKSNYHSYLQHFSQWLGIYIMLKQTYVQRYICLRQMDRQQLHSKGPTRRTKLFFTWSIYYLHNFNFSWNMLL
jgi:hypothetical protein